MNTQFFAMYPGRDFGSTRQNAKWPHKKQCSQKMFDRKNYTFEQILKKARELDAKIIISTNPTKTKDGKYYLKGMEFDWDFCKVQLEECTYTTSTRKAYLLTRE